MTAPPPMFFVWNGSELEPMERFSWLAEQSFTSGHCYKMMVVEEGERRSSEQNAKMWAMLTEIAASGELRDQRWTPDQWKSIFMQSLGHPVEVLPSLDGKSWFPASLSSSRLSKGQMAEMIECMLAWGTENGVVFQDDPVTEDVAS